MDKEQHTAWRECVFICAVLLSLAHCHSPDIDVHVEQPQTIAGESG